MKELTKICSDIRNQFFRWGAANEPNFRPTAQALVRVLPQAATRAKLELSLDKKLSEKSKQELSELLSIAEQCARHLKAQGDNFLGNQLTSALWAVKAHCFDIAKKIAPPMIDPDASDSFKFHVKNVVESLPLDAQKRIGDEAFFFELSATRTQGLFIGSSAERKQICIASGMPRDQLRLTIAHEAAHLFLGHKTGGHSNETAAQELAAAWGFQN